MTLSLDIKPEAENRLRELAAKAGQDVTAFATQIIERAVSQPSVDDILAPLQDQVNRSGMSDEELDELFRSELSAVRAQKRAKSA